MTGVVVIKGHHRPVWAHPWHVRTITIGYKTLNCVSIIRHKERKLLLVNRTHIAKCRNTLLVQTISSRIVCMQWNLT